MDALKFYTGLAEKVVPGKYFQSIRKVDNPIKLGDELRFIEIDEDDFPVHQLGTGRCIGISDIEIQDKSVSVLCRQGSWKAELLHGHKQPLWYLPIDTRYGDGSWGICSFTADAEALDLFAKAEGFFSWSVFVCWVADQYGLPFKGKMLICEVDA
ncbi:hypothetical protein [Bradyrhizobium sp.]|uniref:hypothetical protein n=1 Tax=Bradyrhizobium sp. TaxID=376 RepID=UPI0027337DFD|nr:hypothetical protein [Bradyrhizobium sp.]MDP3078658.1 hypothetical protein [Bradyrhizobium sp.]